MRALSTYLGHRNLADTCWLKLTGFVDTADRTKVR